MTCSMQLYNPYWKGTYNGFYDYVHLALYFTNFESSFETVFFLSFILIVLTLQTHFLGIFSHCRDVAKKIYHTFHYCIVWLENSHKCIIHILTVHNVRYCNNAYYTTMFLCLADKETLL